MIKIRRGGYVFLPQRDEGSLLHARVHVYRNGFPVLKWDLEHGKPMAGNPSACLFRLISQLEIEGLL